MARNNNKIFTVLLVAFTVIALLRIVSTYTVFNQTTDEPAHIAAGMEWIDNHTYFYEPHHPPLSRIALALGPYLDGAHLTPDQKEYLANIPETNRERYRRGWYNGNLYKAMWNTGNHILYSGDSYFRTLSLARMGNLPFFIIAILLIWYWSRDIYDRSTAVIAVGIFSTLPPVLAHAGLATTDMSITATLLLCVIAFHKWIAKPDLTRSVFLGIAGALAILSKFSSLLFFPMIAIAFIIWRWIVIKKDDCTIDSQSLLSKSRSKSLLIAFFVAFISIWAVYQFSVAPLKPASSRPHEIVDRYIDSSSTVHDLAYQLIESPIIPAQQLVIGIRQVAVHNKSGHRSYLLGEVKTDGWWYFFPVTLSVKIPIAILFMIISGIVIGFYRSRKKCQWSLNAPILAALAIVIGSLYSSINIGVRHILPAFPFFAMIAAYSITTLWKYSDKKMLHIIIVFLGVWHLYSTSKVHPDYLSYFNEFARNHPENLLINSDLDWGQDLQRLSNYLKHTDIDNIKLAYQGTTDVLKHDLPNPRLIEPGEKVIGWVAATIYRLRFSEGYEWLEEYEPKAYIGKTFRLYYIPEKQNVLSTTPQS